jgi:hypothetical protein
MYERIDATIVVTPYDYGRPTRIVVFHKGDDWHKLADGTFSRTDPNDALLDKIIESQLPVTIGYDWSGEIMNPRIDLVEIAPKDPNAQWVWSENLSKQPTVELVSWVLLASPYSGDFYGYYLITPRTKR